MKRYTLVLLGLAATAAPLAAQHDHPAASTPPRPAAAATAPCASGMGMSGMSGRGGMSGMSDMTGMMMMDSMMPVMNRMHAFAPASLLGRATALELSADQQARLGRIRSRTEPAVDSAMIAMRARQRDLVDALAPELPDAETVEARFAAMHEAMGLAHQIQLRAAVQAMGVLTGAQRVRAAAAQASM